MPTAPLIGPGKPRARPIQAHNSFKLGPPGLTEPRTFRDLTGYDANLSLRDAGYVAILEEDPPRPLVHEWQALYDPDLAAEETSRVTWEIEPQDGGITKLTPRPRPARGRSQDGGIGGRRLDVRPQRAHDGARDRPAAYVLRTSRHASTARQSWRRTTAGDQRNAEVR